LQRKWSKQFFIGPVYSFVDGTDHVCEIIKHILRNLNIKISSTHSLNFNFWYTSYFRYLIIQQTNRSSRW